MPFVITSECVNCGVCVDVCPVSAIAESDGIHIITDSCVGCGKCQQTCPVEAIRGNGH